MLTLALLIFSAPYLDAQDKKAIRTFTDYKIVLRGTDSQGNTISGVEKEKLRKKCNNWLRENSKKYRRDYPLYLHSLRIMQAATSKKVQPNIVCNRLQKMCEALEIHRKRGDFEGKMKDYLDKFGVSEKTIDFFYNSEYAIIHGIVRGERCEPMPNPEPSAEPVIIPEPPVEREIVSELTEVVISGPSGQKFIVRPDSAIYISATDDTYTAKNVILLLKELIDFRKLDSDFLELRQLNVGDERLLKPLGGTGYNVGFKHSETKKIFYFPGGEYVIKGSSDEQFFSDYDKSMNEFTSLVIQILEFYGGDCFQIVTQGIADNVEFSPKKLTSGYDGDDFRRITLIRQNDTEDRLLERILLIRLTYMNPLLPNLRGAFVKYALTRNEVLKKHKDRIHILEGRVTERQDDSDRNCTIVVFIDWEKALIHAENMTLAGH